MAAVALAMGATGCGDDSDEPARLASAAPQAPPAVPPAPPPRSKASPRWARKGWGDGLYANARGVLVKPDGGEVRGWGDRRVRRHVTALFARMQYDFLTGDMASVCRHVDSLPTTLATDLPGYASCDRTLRAYARKLERQEFKPTPLRFLWVRTYPGVAGIWVEDRRGKRFRVPFVQQGNSGWRVELEDLFPLEALAMPLRASELGG